MIRVLMPLPAIDFDPTEAAVSWRILSDRAIQVEFATPEGKVAAADPLMLSGNGLDFLAAFKLLGSVLRASGGARRDYARLVADAAFRSPLAHAAIETKHYDGLLLPGGHCARGMRPYLESEWLQAKVAEFFDDGKPVAAICHGVLLAARSMSKTTGQSVLYNRKTTALTWQLESSAWRLMKVAGRRWDPDYYRTYVEGPGDPPGYCSVQAEVTRALAQPQDFQEPRGFVPASGLFRDSDSNPAPAFVVRDGNYISARWPGDAHRFAREFAAVLHG